MRHAAWITGFLLVGAVPATAGAAERVSVKDPAGGARWTATQSAASGGRTCVRLARGKVAKGRLCARLTRRVAFSYTLRTEASRDPRRTRTVLVVLLAPDVVRARLTTPDGPRHYRRRSGRPRVLLAVLAGRVERPPLRVDVRQGDRTVVVRQGGEPAVQVADPVGGPAWRTLAAAGSGGGVCASWQRVAPRYGPAPEPARGTPRCGDPDADVPVAAAQRVDGRLVVFGVAGAGVRSLVLRGSPAGDRSVALEASTRAFLAVLPGGTDPAGLRLVARLGEGRDVERALDVVK